MPMRNRVIVLAAVLAVLASTAARVTAETIVYDLAGDWSDTNNPNGRWSYNSAPAQANAPAQAITQHWDDYDPQSNLFINPQPAWSWTQNIPGGWGEHVPFWAKIISPTADNPASYNLDLPIGVVGMHGSTHYNDRIGIANVTWTSPIDGTATISGGVWLARKTEGRDMNWRILANGTSMTDGTLLHTDSYTSASPFNFSLGSGGMSALTIPVFSGEVITLELFKALTSQDNYGEFVGVNLTITAEGSPVPEPSTLAALSGIGAIGLAIAYRRRKRTAA